MTNDVRSPAEATLVESPAVSAPKDPSERAVRAFRERHPDLCFAPVVVVIPAFNEEDAIGAVLDDAPREACGLSVDTLVIDDGSVDGTARVARNAGVYVAALEENSGQGAALRLGYRLAREHGAKYIVTLDADGQWDPADVSRLLEPILADEADFVLGSRVLGRAETDDSFRQAGVRVFAFVVRLLTGAHVTDTSSGVRAFVVEVTDTVRQEEPQYQASELLVGAICQGYRIAERPVVMHKRTAGESKKGHNLLYGLRYGRALLRTWWRDRGSGKPAQAETKPRPRRAGIPGLLVDTLAENRLAVIVLGAGAALRGLVFFAYDPFLWVPTSSGYIAAAGAVRPSEAHPWGYSGFLWLTGQGLGHREIVLIQHVLLLALAGLLYAFLVHLGVVRWLAALAVVPLSLSPLLANIEHRLLPDALFAVLVSAALLVLVWSRHRPAVFACAAAGLLAAAAGFVQLFGLVMIVPMVVFLIGRRAGFVRLGALLIAFAIPLGGYLVWMHQVHGVYAFTTWRGKHLYARVAPFAQCDRLGSLGASQRLLCDSRPVEARPGPGVVPVGRSQGSGPDASRRGGSRIRAEDDRSPASRLREGGRGWNRPRLLSRSTAASPRAVHRERGIPRLESGRVFDPGSGQRRQAQPSSCDQRLARKWPEMVCTGRLPDWTGLLGVRGPDPLRAPLATGRQRLAASPGCRALRGSRPDDHDLGHRYVELQLPLYSGALLHPPDCRRDRPHALDRAPRSPSD